MPSISTGSCTLKRSSRNRSSPPTRPWPHCRWTAISRRTCWRRVFSGIVAGNVKEQGIRAVEEHGPFEIRAEPAMLAAMDELLQRFVVQQRMKLQGEYTPCYTLVG